VLHQEHNLFGDPTAIPLFLGVSLFLGFAKRAAVRVADRFQVWMVEGEYEYVEVYDEGPGSRKAGALPPGMAAVRQNSFCKMPRTAAGLTRHLTYIAKQTFVFISGGCHHCRVHRGHLCCRLH